MDACQQGTSLCMPRLYHGFSCCVATFSLCKSHSHQSQTLYKGLHLSGPQKGGNLEVPDWGCRVEGVTLFNQIPWRFLSLQTCVHPCTVMLKQDVWWTLVGPNSFEMLPNFCQHPDVGITSWLSPLSASHPRESLLHSPRKLIMTLLTDRIFSSRKIENGVNPCTNFLSQVQNDGPRFHLL